MADIIRITIKGSSGFCCINEAYNDKITIEPRSIQYEYIPVMESNINMPRKWSYRTTSPVYQKLFKEVAVAVETILNRGEEPDVTDIGATSFMITYDDKTKRGRDFFLPGDDFKECFLLIKQMVPGCEYTPVVLLTSEDYEEE